MDKYEKKYGNKCEKCGSDKIYYIDNKDKRNELVLDDDEDPNALFFGCDNCHAYNQIERGE